MDCRGGDGVCPGLRGGGRGCGWGESLHTPQRREPPVLPIAFGSVHPLCIQQSLAGCVFPPARLRGLRSGPASAQQAGSANT